MMIKALVNGKEVMVKVEKSYNNGIQEVFEGTMDFNGQQVWVAVAASEVIEKIMPKARLKAEYKGDREDSECRAVEFTVTAKTKQDVENMMGMLDKYFTEQGYEMARCSSVEEFNGVFTYIDSITVEDPAEGKEVLRQYKKFKEELKG